MKSKIFNFIIKANQILFFLAAIAIIGAVAISILPHNYSRPIVKIEKNREQNNTKKKMNKIQYFKSFYAHINDVFIIKINADNIIKKEMVKSSLRFMSGEYYMDDKQALVNLIFAKQDKRSYKLLESDAYIISFSLSKKKYIQDSSYRDKHFKLDKNIYTIIVDDTNKDHFLSIRDQKNFYMSNYDGLEMKLVLKDIIKYEIVDDDLVLITKKVNKKEHFYLFNVLTNNLKELNTAL